MEIIYLILYTIAVIFLRHYIIELTKTKKEKLIDNEIKEIREKIKTSTKDDKVAWKSEIIELRLANLGYVAKTLFLKYGLIISSFALFKILFTISIWWYILFIIAFSIIIRRLMKWVQ